MSFVPASFVVYLIDERVSKVKHLHFVSSVPPLTYWISALLWDLTMYLITSIIVSTFFKVSRKNLGLNFQKLFRSFEKKKKNFTIGQNNFQNKIPLQFYLVEKMQL
jgi:hypothetical protein